MLPEFSFWLHHQDHGTVMWTCNLLLQVVKSGHVNTKNPMNTHLIWELFPKIKVVRLTADSHVESEVDDWTSVSTDQFKSSVFRLLGEQNSPILLSTQTTLSVFDSSCRLSLDNWNSLTSFPESNQAAADLQVINESTKQPFCVIGLLNST